jgi:hypothetical protein
MNFGAAALRNTTFVFFLLCAVVTAPAATVNVSYQLTVTATGDPTDPPLIGNGTGSVVPLGSVTWMDMGFPNLATGALTGTFTMTFTDGTLFGNLFEQLDFSAPPNAIPVTQIIDVTGGTGAFLWYNGRLTGSGTINMVTPGPFSPSGTGTLNTTPEPRSIASVAMGLMCLIALYPMWRKRSAKISLRFQKSDQ